jgi:formate dehydrogenase major subunit
MRAAMEASIEIPKLCATDMLDAFGSCRLCLIEAEGRAGTPASCTTPVAEGMVVRTQSDRLDRLRKGIMELYVSDHAVDSLDRTKYPDVELLETAEAVGLKEVRYGFDGARHRNPGIDDSNPYFTFDPAKCIVCSRCVRACEEVQGTFALTVSGRGFDSIIAAGMDEKFMESECVSCGACVQACPTGSLLEKQVIEKGKPEWSALTTCAYCGVGCAFKAEMRGDEVVRMVPYKDGKANRGHSCVKGRFAWGYANHRERILKPTRSPIRGARSPGKKRSGASRPSSSASKRPMGAARSAASRHRAAPTKKPSWCRSWCAPPSATTMSTPARASATRRPATA